MTDLAQTLKDNSSDKVFKFFKKACGNEFQDKCLRVVNLVNAYGKSYERAMADVIEHKTLTKKEARKASVEVTTGVIEC